MLASPTKCVVPDLVEQLLAGEDLAGVAGQEVEQVELLGGQVDRRSPISTARAVGLILSSP